MTNRPFLENFINDSFLKASNNKKMKFCLMWANHNANHLWDKRNSDDILSTVIWSGVVTPEIFSNICDRTIKKYFSKENYYSIDGCPVYIIFDIDNFIRSFGTSDECKKAIEEFCRKTIAAGFKNLHLKFLHWRNRIFNWLNDKKVKNNLLIYENSSHALKDDAETTLKSREIFKRYAEMYL